MKAYFYWDIQIHQDYYKILENNLSNRQHPEVHAYLVKVLSDLSGASSIKEMDSRMEELVSFRNEKELKGMKEYEQKVYNKYVKRWLE